MKIYTKTGDQGETGLYSGRRLPKDDPILEVYGTVDELNSVLGLAGAEGLIKELNEKIGRIQNELFQLGADLATPWDDPNTKNKVDRIEGKAICRLEDEIDGAEKELTPLTQFILPGGARSAAWLHLARTVCRRAERPLAALLRKGRVNPETIVYVNRLSDWLFVMARLENRRAGEKDIPWTK